MAQKQAAFKILEEELKKMHEDNSRLREDNSCLREDNSRLQLRLTEFARPAASDTVCTDCKWRDPKLLVGNVGKGPKSWTNHIKPTAGASIPTLQPA